MKRIYVGFWNFHIKNCMGSPGVSVEFNTEVILYKNR